MGWGVKALADATVKNARLFHVLPYLIIQSYNEHNTGLKDDQINTTRGNFEKIRTMTTFGSRVTQRGRQFEVRAL